MAEQGDQEGDVMLTEVHLERVDGQYTLQASNDAFLDDWFHRGSALGWMCHYVYAMYVKVVPRTEEFQCDRVIPFVSHYKKHTGFVQVLEASPRVPYMVGFTMPSRHGDAATNALYHLCLMKPGSMCRGQCDDVGWLSGHVISHCWPRHQRNMFGFTWPTRKAPRKRGEGRFTEAWKAWEALQLTRAQRGWRKLKAERRVAVLDDVASFRSWYLPNAAKETVVQSWLLPWLLGHFRHVYKGPWKEKRANTQVNPKYSRAQFQALHPLGLACLPALPHSVAVTVLRFAGDVKTEDGQVLIIADEETTQKRQLQNFSTPASVLFTGTGVHMHQLFPEEFAATIQAEVSWNMDLLAEARKRPRPNVVSVFEEEGDEALGGTCAARIEAGEAQNSENESEYDAIVERPYSEERGLQYKPSIEIQNADVLEVVHRLHGWKDGRGA